MKKKKKREISSKIQTIVLIRLKQTRARSERIHPRRKSPLDADNNRRRDKYIEMCIM